MSSDERPESLASQAASWVPPWERPQREPDRDSQASASSSASDEPGPDDDDEDRSAAGLSDDDDDFDPEFEGANPPGYSADGVPPELPPIPGETDVHPTVDAPAELPGDDNADPTDVGEEPELPVPASLESAVETDDDQARHAVDAMLPPDGDDAGDVFDAAADDDITDDGEMDLPISDDVPAGDEASTATDDDDDDDGDGDGDLDDDDPDDDDLDDDDADDGDDLNGVDADVADPDGNDDSDVNSSVAALGDPDPDDDTADASPRDDAPSDAAAADAPDASLRDAAGPADGSDDGVRHGQSASTADDAVDGDVRFAADAAAVAFAAGQADAEAALAGGAAATGPKASGVPAQGRGSRGRATASVETTARTEDDVEVDLEEPAPIILMDESELRPALEAILLVVDEPVQEMQLAQILEQPTERVAEMLEDISARYTAAGHGFDLRRAAGGWRLYTRPEYAAYVERFVLDGQSVRLTQAALETLAVVAYKQPVTRSRISAIRGVNCDGVMRTLVTRSLIEECGIEGETGAHLYRTTTLFLEKLGLNSVDQLPPLAPFLPDDVEEVLDGSG